MDGSSEEHEIRGSKVDRCVVFVDETEGHHIGDNAFMCLHSDEWKPDLSRCQSCTMPEKKRRVNRIVDA